MLPPLPPLPPAARLAGSGLVLLVTLLVVLGPTLVGRPPAGSPPPNAARPASPSPAAPAALAVAAPTATLAAPALYREAIVGLPATLNPLLATSDAELDVARLVFAGLTEADGHGEAQPALAARWTISDDGRAYTFHLRAGATWHDGQPVTARDVLFTVRLLQDSHVPGSQARATLWRTIQVDVVDAGTVRFRLSEPYAPFLSQTAFPLLPAHRLHGVFPGDLAQHDFSQHPIGAGPYRVREGPRDAALLLERHGGYGGPPARVERLLLRFYPDLDQALAALRQGQVDGLAGVPGARLPEVRSQPGLQVQAVEVNSSTALLFNLRRPLFQQKEVRQALALALDRQALIAEALDGAGRAQTGPIVTSSWAYQAAAPSGTIHEARALLERAGWLDADGDGVREREDRRLAFTLVTTDSVERTRVAATIAAQLQAAGVQVTIFTLPAGDLIAHHLAPRDFDAALFGWAALGDDPDPYSLWHSSQADQGYNFAGWQATQADELLEKARTVADRDSRRQAYADFQRLFADEVPSVILYSPHYHLVVSERVRPSSLGPINRPADRFRTIGQWSVEGEPAAGAGRGLAPGRRV